MLCRWKEEERSGLEQFFEQPQIRNMGANGDCAFMLEARDGYFYQNECCLLYTSGNHSYRHIQLTKAGENAVCDAVDQTSVMIEQITGERPQYLRPPYGDWNDNLECKVDMTVSYTHLRCGIRFPFCPPDV